MHRPSEVAGLLYELRPGADVEHSPPRQKPKRVRVNSRGMRGPDVALEKPEGVLRIAVLGDSTTFGYGVEEDETYSSFLQRFLNAAGRRRFEVLNFGVTGYCTRDEAIVLEQRVAEFAPDLIVLGYNLNDPNANPLDSPAARLLPPAAVVGAVPHSAAPATPRPAGPHRPHRRG